MESLHQKLGLHAMVGDIADLGTEDIDIPHFGCRTTGNPRVAGPIFKCRDTTPWSGQDFQRQSGM